MRKNNYNINTNPDKLSSEQIQKHMDFDALLQQYQASPPPKKSNNNRRWLYYVSGAAAAALLGAFLYFNFSATTNISDETYFAEQDYINPPFENLKPEFTTYQLDANNGGEFQVPNGSKLIVPPAAFVNQQGQAVDGDINIRYREYHDYVDFFLSGIPMFYDSSGVRYLLESAGMVEIYAEQDGQRIELNSDKKIDVELVSEINMPKINVPPNYNIYKLDVEKRNWVYQDLDHIQLLDQPVEANIPAEDRIQNAYDQRLQEIAAKETNELNTIEATISKPNAPIQPQRANGSDLVFDFDFGDAVKDNTDLAKLSQQYGSMLWQISPRSPDFKEGALSADWEDIQINQLNNQEYEITFIQGSQQLKLIANPVLTGDKYDNAQKDYQKALTAYQQQLASREAQLSAKKESVKQRMEEEKAIAKIAYEERLAAHNAKNNPNEASAQLVKRKVLNSFQVTSFGIWNCDRPILPEKGDLKAVMVDNNNKQINGMTAFVVDKNKNTVHRFYAKEGCKVPFNKTSDNLLWVVTKDNKLAVYRPEDFKQINQKKGKHTFVMKVEENEITNEKDVRKILDF